MSAPNQKIENVQHFSSQIVLLRAKGRNNYLTCKSTNMEIREKAKNHCESLCICPSANGHEDIVGQLVPASDLRSKMS